MLELSVVDLLEDLDSLVDTVLQQEQIHESKTVRQRDFLLLHEIFHKGLIL